MGGLHSFDDKPGGIGSCPASPVEKNESLTCCFADSHIPWPGPVRDGLAVAVSRGLARLDPDRPDSRVVHPGQCPNPVVAKSRREQWLLRSLVSLGVLAAVLALTVTVVLEARFHWVRHQVLHAETGTLERLGRHFIVGYRDLAEVRDLVRLRAVAGVFVAGHNVQGKSIPEIREEMQSLQNGRQKQGLPQLWIATDQEGGVVSRLSPPLSRLPALSEIVERHSDMGQRQQAVREFAKTQGRELAGLGVNLNFAPVVDINHQVINPNDRYTRIFERAISSDPAVVAQVAASVLRGIGGRRRAVHLEALSWLGQSL